MGRKKNRDRRDGGQILQRGRMSPSCATDATSVPSRRPAARLRRKKSRSARRRTNSSAWPDKTFLGNGCDQRAVAPINGAAIEATRPRGRWTVLGVEQPFIGAERA